MAQEMVKKNSIRSLIDDDTNSNSYDLPSEIADRLNEEIYEDDYEDDFEDEESIDIFERYESFYFKYLFEGCTTIDEIVSQLNNLTSLFEQYKQDGHELVAPVESGYCFIDSVLNQRDV